MLMNITQQQSSRTASAHANSPCEDEMKWNEHENEMKWNEMRWNEMRFDPPPKSQNSFKKIGLKKCFLLIKFFLKINDLRSSQRVPLQVACPPQIVYPCHPLLINPCSRCPNHMQSILNPMILPKNHWIYIGNHGIWVWDIQQNH